MSWSTKAVLAAACLAGATGVCAAQTANPAATPAPAAPAPAAPATAPSFDGLVGKKLTAIDGSAIALTPAEGGIAREIVSGSGGIQRTYFAFINERLGTVADANDIRRVTGVFRRVENGIEIQYADGSTEKLALNPGGGLTLETAAAAATACVSWYPEGHSYSIEERKAALAAFAVKLGLADAGSKDGKTDCAGKAGQAAALPPAVLTLSAAAEAGSGAGAGKIKFNGPANATADAGTGAGAGKGKLNAATANKAAELSSGAGTGKAASEPGKALQTGKGAPVVPPIPTQAPRGVLAASGTAPALVTPSTAAIAAEAQAIEVRKSEVHPIDAAPAAESKPQVLASAGPPDSSASDQHGASTCLSVESNGMHWGFRNHCGYDVQFAYCLMSGNPLAACHDGAVAGSVAANGFGALVADESLKETDAKHDFRWVACQGGAGEVIPHLDQTDPPSGRCVR
jgi:hypothetical protein